MCQKNKKYLLSLLCTILFNKQYVKWFFKKNEKYESLLKKEKEKVKHNQSINVSSENIVKETFPKYWKEYHYIVVIDSNVLIDNHESFLNFLKPHAGIIIPNSVRGVLNGLKKVIQ